MKTAIIIMPHAYKFTGIKARLYKGIKVTLNKKLYNLPNYLLITIGINKIKIYVWIRGK